MMMRQLTHADITRVKGDVTRGREGTWTLRCPPQQVGQAAGCRLFTNVKLDSILRYTVTLASDFDAVKGGKLPGVFGPDWSVRVMFRHGRSAELYVHTVADPRPFVSPEDCRYIGIVNGEHVVSLWRGKWTLPLGMPIQVQIDVRGPGKLGLAINNVGFRMAYPVIKTPPAGLLLVFFYGGSDPSWAPNKRETVTLSNVFTL